jgi:hypothetical protein
VLRIIVEALYVIVGVESNTRVNIVPAGTVPNEVIGPVDPEIWTKLPVAVAKLTVAAEAIVVDLDRLSGIFSSAILFFDTRIAIIVLSYVKFLILFNNK